ncbi:Mut7-C RNAse domain-containing protein [Stygiolobus sp. CP850M]|uniref:Mut7-C RNAse domain-containing protein n=1 Tax=Stygiolobus sp. CP850M TaxID=3133134 RepID=UPI00307D6C1C
MQTQKFVVDAMLGKLARWLRILGYDTAYNNNFVDWKILKIASDENRIIITRDRGLCVRARKRGLECFYVIPGLKIEEILAKLSSKYSIDLNIVDPNFSRCSVCNGVLKKVNDNLWECTRCHKKYWKGSHWRTIESTLIRARAILKNNESRQQSISYDQ